MQNLQQLKQLEDKPGEGIPTSLIDFKDTQFSTRAVLKARPELVASIKSEGQQSPCLLRLKTNGKFQIIFGWQRSLACRQLGIPVKFKLTDAKDDICWRLAISENQARKDLSPLDIYNVVEKSQQNLELGLANHGELARQLGITAWTVICLADLRRYPSLLQVLAQDAWNGVAIARALDLYQAYTKAGIKDDKALTRRLIHIMDTEQVSKLTKYSVDVVYLAAHLKEIKHQPLKVIAQNLEAYLGQRRKAREAMFAADTKCPFCQRMIPPRVWKKWRTA